MTDSSEQQINLKDNSDQETSRMADKQEQEQPQEQGQEPQAQAKEGGSMSSQTK